MHSLWLIVVLAGAAVTLGSVSSAVDPKPEPKGRQPVKVTEEALKIHREAIVIDGHNDLAWELRDRADLSFQKIDLAKRQTNGLHTDIPRLKEGGVGAQFWAAYVPTKTSKTKTSVRDTLEQIDCIHRMVKTYPDAFEMASNAEDIVRIRKAGKIASLIGVEGGHSIDNSLAVLRSYYKLGVRYLTLTHSENTDWADSATDEPKAKGLTEFGEQVIREMNKLGMLVDISHVSHDTMRHVLKVSKAPAIASHSCAYSVAEHPRNVPDDVLRAMKEKDGVVMINFFPGFVTPEGARARKDMFKVGRELRAKYPDDKEFMAALQQWKKENPYPLGSVHNVVDHIDYIVKVAGVDHVGLGSDFDGIPEVPKQLEDVACFPHITQELLNRGYKKEDIHKILGGNVLRVMRKAEDVAKSWKD